MTTPVVADLNNDGRLEEMVIPVSYFFDEEEYRYTVEQKKRVFGLVWFGLMLNVPVNNFSVMLGRSHCFLGITSTFGG